MRAAWLLVAVGSAAAAADIGGASFTDRRDPPPFRALDATQREQYDLGHALFNTLWVPAATPRAQRRDGLGPLFSAAACDACHNEGARSQRPVAGEGLPAGLVLQLSGKDGGDPAYGHVLNTAALQGFAPEAVVRLKYHDRQGRYPDGSPWTLHEPRYVLDHLNTGPLATDIRIKPRLAPALFGAGLLEAVPDAAIVASTKRARHVAWREEAGIRRVARFGWQADSLSIAEQTARAFSREMGLSSTLIPHDDCTARQTQCVEAEQGGQPEVADELFEALLSFQRELAVPIAESQPTDAQAGAALFVDTGCAACHRPRLPVVIDGAEAHIAPYTDLLRHDLGSALADRTVRGRVVKSLWRTAPLWGLGHVLRSGREFALLHDGRAHSVEEAVLWHEGEAAASRGHFMRLPAAQRQQLLDWVASR